MPRRRPQVYTANSCPVCHRRIPTDHRYNPFTELYGHRCPHGMPCPSFGRAPRGVHDCTICYQAQGTEPVVETLEELLAQKQPA